MLQFLLQAIYGLCCGMQSEKERRLLHRVCEDVRELTNEELDHLTKTIGKHQPVKNIRCCYF